jgi:hypothetical protein
MKAYRIRIQNGAVKKSMWFGRESEARTHAKSVAEKSPEDVEIECCKLKSAAIVSALNGAAPSIADSDVESVMVLRGRG